MEEVPSSPTRELDEAVSPGSVTEQSDKPSARFVNHNLSFSFCVVLSSQSTENSPLGTFLKGFIDVPTCHVGESFLHCDSSMTELSINLNDAV